MCSKTQHTILINSKLIGSFFQIKVIAYDPSKLDNTNYLNLIVMIRDQSATSPVFDRTQLSIPYQVYLQGTQGGTLVAKLNLAKYNVGVTSIVEPIICYYIVGEYRSFCLHFKIFLKKGFQIIWAKVIGVSDSCLSSY